MKTEGPWFAVGIAAAAFASVIGVLGPGWAGPLLTALALTAGAVVLRRSPRHVIGNPTIVVVMVSTAYLAVNALVLARFGAVETLDHAVRLLAFGVVFTGLGVQVVAGEENRRRQLQLAFVGAGLLASLAATGLLGTDPADLSVPTIELGRAAALAVLVLLLADWLPFSWRIPLLGCTIVGVVASGSRGAIVSLLVGLLAAFLHELRGRLTVSRVRWVLTTLVTGTLIVGTALAALVSLSGSETRSLAQRAAKAEELADIEQVYASQSVVLRTDVLYARAYESFLDRPILGTGMANGVMEDSYAYAHNIYLELAAGAGIAGIAFGVLYTAVIIGGAFAARSRTAVALPPFFLATAQFSGDLTINRFLFLGLGIAATSSHLRRLRTRRGGGVTMDRALS